MTKKLLPLMIVLAMIIMALPACQPKKQALNIYAWSSELPQEVVDAFQAETGIVVTVDTFDSNEALIAKLEAGATGYDLVNPSQYAVPILATGGLLLELDHSKLKNYDNLGEVFKNVSFDVGNVTSLPYLWGTTGLAYNDECVTTPITSWSAMWDPQYTGRIYMLDNMLAAYIAGLQVNGFHANTTDPNEIAIATQSLIDQKTVLGGYNSTNFAELVSSGEACIVEAWSGNVVQVMNENPHVQYVVPDEGGSMWVDSYSITKSAVNVDAAYQFMDYLLRPEVAAKVTEVAGIATSVDASKALLPPEIADNPAIFPPADRLAKTDFIVFLGDAMTYYQDGWTQVKAATP
jgi:spermidine/putrescine transport system substrate-binding protein